MVAIEAVSGPDLHVKGFLLRMWTLDCQGSHGPRKSG
jgi:hypothetical protein